MLADHEPAKRNPLTVIKCVRSLYLGFEKGFKGTVAEIDPYLLISKPDHSLLLQLRRDVLSRPVPSLFCSRQPIETLNMLQTWKLICELQQVPVSESVLADFERALGRLAQIRHRAQHSEFYEDLDDVLALIEQLLARFRDVVGAINPDWLQELFTRNGQLESLLKGIENQIDGAWQVLVDYLHRFGPLKLQTELYLVHESGSESIRAILGDTNTERENHIFANADISTRDVQGLFGLYLTQDQSDSRRRMRESRMQPPPLIRQTGWLGAFLNGTSTPSTPLPKKPMIPLDPGSIWIIVAPGWLTLKLTQIKPNFLFLSVLLVDLHIEFSDPNKEDGSVNGKLECAVKHGSTDPGQINVSGQVHLLSEWCVEGEAEGTQPKPPRTIRQLELELELTAT